PPVVGVRRAPAGGSWGCGPILPLCPGHARRRLPAEESALWRRPRAGAWLPKPGGGHARGPGETGSGPGAAYQVDRAGLVHAGIAARRGNPPFARWADGP